MTAQAPTPKLPPLSISVVDTYTPEGSTEERRHWTEVGRGFPNRDAEGYSLVLRSGLSISGTVSLRTPKPADEAVEAAVKPIFRQQLSAFVVENYTPDGSSEERSKWTDIGSAFPNRDGRGWNLVIRPGLAVFGQIVLRAPRPEDRSADKPPFR